MIWQAEHDKMLKEQVAAGWSFANIATKINARFEAGLSRNACIGRALRLGLSKPRAPRLPQEQKKPVERPARPRAAAKTNSARLFGEMKFACDESGLRVADVIPRNISLHELTEATCKWPYGDGPFTFCGCVTFGEVPYCEPHTALGTGQGSRGEQHATSGLRRVA